MAESRKAVIIGAGIGGITTAVFLAMNGYAVDVYEKNVAPGGRCSRLVRDGHRFDLGATMLLMPEMYRTVFKSLGLDLEKSIPMSPLKELYKIYFDDGKTLSFTTDKGRMKDQLESIEKGSYLKSERYVSDGYSIYNLSLRELINRNFLNLFQLVNLKNVPVLFKVKAFTPHFKYAKKYFNDPHLLMAYTFQNIYVGQSPFNSPALFSMVPAAELTEGSFFPSGGMFTIAEKLIEKGMEAGVRYHFNSPVKKITVNGKKAKGIMLQDGSEILADIVVANADLPYVYRELLPDSRMSEHLDGLKYTCSAICFHWGIDKQYPQLAHHSVFLSEDYDKGLDSIFREKSVGDNPSFYIQAPAQTDPSAAPPGHDSLSVIVAAGHIDKNFRQDWTELTSKARAAVIKKLKNLGIDDLEDHIKFEIAYTPENWQEACNISRGSVFGSLSHNIFQMAYFRPHNRHDRYRNLYFTGGSTHPGNGIPNVLMSAKLVTERIFHDEKLNL